MGNMGYPVITRLGTNQFWYKHWYSDKLYATNIQQLDLLETLINFYLKHGLSYTSNFFIHEYWYKHAVTAGLRSEVVDQQLKSYFRRYFYAHSVLSIEHNYLLRHKTQEYFPMRTWVLKYHNWVIFSIQWFKPVKTKQKQTFLRSASFVGAIHKTGQNHLYSHRPKLILMYMIRSLKYNNSMYNF
jgi:hypothetical protein